MHELGICDALLKMVDGIARDEGLACVRKVTVEVGSLSGIPCRLLGCRDRRDAVSKHGVCGRDAAGRRTVHRLRREIHC